MLRAILVHLVPRNIQIGTSFAIALMPSQIQGASHVLRYSWLFLTHAALAPAKNQMSGPRKAGFAPRFSLR
jgi:hypothetical protein